MPHIVDMLSDWLKDTIQLRENDQKAQLTSVEAMLTEDGHKIITSLTVLELGLFTRLCIEAGVYRTKNKKALSRMMARTFATFQKEVDEEFSVDHLYGSIYTTNESTIISVQQILKRMQDKLERVKEEQTAKKKRNQLPEN
jgi:transcription initiation factor IIE alpha subunit